MFGAAVLLGQDELEVLRIISSLNSVSGRFETLHSPATGDRRIGRTNGAILRDQGTMAARPAHPHWHYGYRGLLRSRRRVPIASFPVCAVLDGHRSTVGPVRRSRDVAARVQGDVTGIVRPRARYRTGPRGSRRARPSPPGRQADVRSNVPGSIRSSLLPKMDGKARSIDSVMGHICKAALRSAGPSSRLTEIRTFTTGLPNSTAYRPARPPHSTAAPHQVQKAECAHSRIWSAISSASRS